MAIKKYTDKYFLSNEVVVPETKEHLYNQIINYKDMKTKYPVNFDYLCAAAIYVLDKIKEDPEVAQDIRKYLSKIKSFK